MTPSTDTTAPPALCPACGRLSRNGVVRPRDGANEGTYLCSGTAGGNCDRVWIVRWVEAC